MVGVETVRPSEDDFPPEPTDEEEAAGQPAIAQARLDDVVDANIVAAAGLDAAAMGVSARWAGLPVTIDFRLGRYGSHIREHTVQVDKTLEMLGRRPSEVERLVRLVLATYGRLEGLLVGRRPDDLERPLGPGASASSPGRRDDGRRDDSGERAGRDDPLIRGRRVAQAPGQRPGCQEQQDLGLNQARAGCGPPIRAD